MVSEGLGCVAAVEDVPVAVELFVVPSVVCGDVPVAVESFVVPPVVCAVWKCSAEMLNQIFKNSILKYLLVKSFPLVVVPVSCVAV